MYRNYFLLALIAFTVSHCESAPETQDCSMLKSGRYRINNEKNGLVTILSRTGNKQAEVVEGEIDSSFMEVRWTGNCQYELHYMEGDPTIPDSLRDFAEANPVLVKILKVEKDYYIYRAEIKGIEQLRTDTAFNAE